MEQKVLYGEGMESRVEEGIQEGITNTKDIIWKPTTAEASSSIYMYI